MSSVKIEVQTIWLDGTCCHSQRPKQPTFVSGKGGNRSSLISQGETITTGHDKNKYNTLLFTFDLLLSDTINGVWYIKILFQCRMRSISLNAFNEQRFLSKKPKNPKKQVGLSEKYVVLIDVLRRNNKAEIIVGCTSYNLGLQ